MNRREYLVAVGAASSCGLAGCNVLSGGREKTESESSTPVATLVKGPAQFTDFKIETKGKATVGSPVSLTVSGFNYGTKSGSYNGHIVTTEGADAVSASFTLSDVSSGQRGKTTVDLSFTVADEYGLGISETSIPTTETNSWEETETPAKDVKTTTKIVVDPQEAAVGESFDFGELLRVTVTDVTYRQGAYYSIDEEKVDLFSTSSGKILAVIRFEIENIGTESASFSAAPFTVSGGELYTGLPDNTSLSSITDIKRSPVVDVSVESGQKIRGWFLAQVSRKQAKKGATVGWQRDTHKTTPEKVWTVKPAKLPSFSLEQWTLDKKQTLGKSPYKITVKNTGGEKEMFRGILDYKRKGEGRDAWSPFKKVRAAIPAGKTKTFDLRTNWPYTNDLDYRVRPFGKTRSVNFQIPKLSFGEKTAIPNGTVRVSKAQTSATYKTESGDVFKPGDLAGSEDGDRFAFAYVEFMPNKSGYIDTPTDDNFTLRANGNSYTETHEAGGIQSIVSPFEGTFDIDSGKARPGQPMTGWLSYSIPSNVSTSNINITLKKEYGYDGLVSEVKWSNG